MLIIKNATANVASMRAIRHLLTRIDVNRDRGTYDIYIAGSHTISMDYVTIYDQHYLNIRVFDHDGLIGSVQLNTHDFDFVQLI